MIDCGSKKGLTRPTVMLILSIAFGLSAFSGCRQAASWIDRPQLAAPPGVLAPTAVAGYDTNDDGYVNYLQIFDHNGRKRRLIFDNNYNGAFDQLFILDDLQDTSTHRTLLVLLDGVSYNLIEQLYLDGHFRLFYPPGRVVGGFPTVTDTIYADFFQTPRPLGYEAVYLDPQTGRKAGGPRFYLRGGNEPEWPGRMLYRQPHLYDGLVYLMHDRFSRLELNNSIQAAEDWLQDEDGARLAAIYMVNTDAIGHGLGHESLKDFLRRVDTALEKLVWLSGGKLRLIVMADHGINQNEMRRVKLEDSLEAAGFNLTDSPSDDCDVFIPTFGLVSHVALYTRLPQQVAAASAATAGVELAIYQDQAGRVFVMDGHGGRAEIQRRRVAESNSHAADSKDFVATDGDKSSDHATIDHSTERPDLAWQYRYLAIEGDPLLLLPIIERMHSAGQIAEDGWAWQRAWLEATWDHRWPDPLARLAHAFEGNVRYPSQVLLSLAPKYYHGQSTFDLLASLRGTHGSLHADATTTFVLSNFFQPPAYQRIWQLRDDLKSRLQVQSMLPEAGNR